MIDSLSDPGTMLLNGWINGPDEWSHGHWKKRKKKNVNVS